jgi:hypothetical protein
MIYVKKRPSKNFEGWIRISKRMTEQMGVEHPYNKTNLKSIQGMPR